MRDSKQKSEYSYLSDAERGRLASAKEIGKLWDDVFGSKTKEIEFDGDFREDEPDFEKKLRGLWNGFIRVGQGKVTNGIETGKKACGNYYGTVGCPHVEKHKFTDLYGVNHSNKIPWFKLFRYCDKPECCECYKHGWAVREARSIEKRIKAAEQLFGKAEHLVWSPSSKHYGLSFEKLREMMFRDLKACHVIGGVEIFHMERFAKAWEAREKGVPEGWRISLHFHIIGFIDGGFSRCRLCKKSKLECLKCDGFDGCARRVHFGYVDGRGRKHEGNGNIIKVAVGRRTHRADERSSVFGTAWYQLNHATMRVGVKRQRVARWFGVCSYRKMHLKNDDRFVRKCPLCGEDLVHIRYVGEGRFDGGCDFLREGESDFFDSNGVPQWVVEGS